MRKLNKNIIKCQEKENKKSSDNDGSSMLQKKTEVSEDKQQSELKNLIKMIALHFENASFLPNSSLPESNVFDLQFLKQFIMTLNVLKSHCYAMRENIYEEQLQEERKQTWMKNLVNGTQ